LVEGAFPHKLESLSKCPHYQYMPKCTHFWPKRLHYFRKIPPLSYQNSGWSNDFFYKSGKRFDLLPI